MKPSHAKTTVLLPREKGTGGDSELDRGWLPDCTSSLLMLQVLRRVCATKDQLSESLRVIDGSEKVQPIIKIMI